jgi:hypothetical protein
MSARTDEDGHSPRDGADEAPFDPADYARNETEPSPESGSGEEELRASGPRWLQLAKDHWLKAVGGVLFLALVADCFVTSHSLQWFLFFCLYLLAEMVFSESRTAAWISSFIMLGILFWDYLPLGTFDSLYLMTAELIAIQLFERSVPLKLANLPFLGLAIGMSFFSIPIR